MADQQPTLLDRVRAELVLAGIGRDPRVAGADPGPPYPVYREPKLGTPAPGEGAGVERDSALVMGLFVAPKIPMAPKEAFMRIDAVTFHIRAKNYPLVEALERDLYDRFADQMNWLMGPIDGDLGERIIHSREWGGMQRVDSGEEGHIFNCQYSFQRYVPAMVG